MADVQSEPTPDELGKPLPPPPNYGKEKDLVELVNQRFTVAKGNRRVAEREWTLGVAMYEDRQWLAWDETAHQAISIAFDDEIDRYVQHNLIRPLIDSMCALATKNKPDSTPAPRNPSKLSQDAAAEARAITSHLWRKHDRPMQMLDLVWWASVCGVCYLKDTWEPDCDAPLALMNPDGSVQGEVSAKIGDVESEVIPPYAILVDPRARTWKKAAWIIEDHVMDLSEAEEQFGMEIQPDADSDGNWFDSYLPEGARFGGVSSLGPFQIAETPKRSVRVKSMYERPTKRFPNGRYICCTKSRLLHAGPMPLKDKWRFPFARLVFKEAAAHPYGLGIVRSLAPIQVEVNRYCTKILNHVESLKDTVVMGYGAKAGADAFVDDVEDKRTLRVLHWDAQGGIPEPNYLTPPQVTPDVWKAIDQAWLHMQHIAGIHDQTNAMAPPGVTSGVAIELLQEADRTQLGLFTQRIEQFAVERDELDIALYAQFAASNLPRLMGIDDTGDPNQARTQVMAFKALTGGGSVDVICRPGSAIPKSAAGELQEMYDLFDKGILNPQNPAGQVFLKAAAIPRSDRMLQLIGEIQVQMLQALQQQMASQPPQPDPAQREAIKQRGETQRLQMQLQGEYTKQQQATQAQFALNAQEAQLKMLLAAGQARAEVGAKTLEQSVSHSAKIREDMNKAALELHVARHMPTPPQREGLKKKG